jgi:hypothetical protein
MRNGVENTPQNLCEEQDVLTETEEAVLTALRGIVSGVRAEHAELEITTLAAALVAAGAARAGEGPEPGTVRFEMEGVAFKIRRSIGPVGGIEVCFLQGPA